MTARLTPAGATPQAHRPRTQLRRCSKEDGPELRNLLLMPPLLDGRLEALGLGGAWIGEHQVTHDRDRPPVVTAVHGTASLGEDLVVADERDVALGVVAGQQREDGGRVTVPA